MAYYLNNEREKDVFNAYRNYQVYLQSLKSTFPPSAFALGTAEWYQDPNDHRCPHDAWLERLTITEPATGERNEQRTTTIRIRLLGAYYDGFIELFYPQVVGYSLNSPKCARGLGDWRYDEFRLSPAGHLIHEIEWAGFGRTDQARWIIESSDVQFKWIPN